MDTSPPGSLPKPSSPQHCAICGKPIALETAKTNGEGKAIHEECYALQLKLESAKQDGQADSPRPWKLVAAEVLGEQDPKKMTELITELNQALDEQNLDGTPKPKPNGDPEPDSK